MINRCFGTFAIFLFIPPNNWGKWTQSGFASFNRCRKKRESSVHCRLDGECIAQIYKRMRKHFSTYFWATFVLYFTYTENWVHLWCGIIYVCGNLVGLYKMLLVKSWTCFKYRAFAKHLYTQIHIGKHTHARLMAIYLNEHHFLRKVVQVYHFICWRLRIISFAVMLAVAP